jgi:hypothetical protein
MSSFYGKLYSSSTTLLFVRIPNSKLAKQDPLLVLAILVVGTHYLLDNEMLIVFFSCWMTLLSESPIFPRI